MKRIITTGIYGLVVAVFFTGCSPLNKNMRVDFEEIQTSAGADVRKETNENGENRLGFTDERKTNRRLF